VEKEEYLMKVNNAAFPKKLIKSLSLRILRTSRYLPETKIGELNRK